MERASFPCGNCGRTVEAAGIADCPRCGAPVSPPEPELELGQPGAWAGDGGAPESPAADDEPESGLEFKEPPPAPDPEIRITETESDLDVREAPEPPDPESPPPRRRPGLPKEPPPDPGDFVDRLPGVFVYPFSSTGGTLFLVLTIPIWAIMSSWIAQITIIGIVGYIVLGGYVALYSFSVLLETADGKDKAPSTPVFSDLADLVGNFFRFFWSGVAAFWPVGALLVYAWVSDPDLADDWGFWFLQASLFLAGILYYPMSLMLIGFSGSWTLAFNYPFGVRSLLRIPGTYLLCCVFFLVMFAGAWGLGLYQEFVAEQAGMGGLFFAALAASFWELYLYVVQMRVLGLLYITNREKLAWFRR